MSSPPPGGIKFRLHYAVQHELEKPLALFWLFRPSNADVRIRYTTSSITFKTRTELSDSLHRILSEQRPEKTCREKKPRQEIWVGSMAAALKSPSYEDYTAERSLHLFTKRLKETPAKLELSLVNQIYTKEI